MTTPPECSSKLAPRWKGPFFVKRVPNAYQVTYEDDMVWRTVHINHVKPAKTPAEGFPIPVPTPKPPLPPLVHLPRSMQRKRPAKLPPPAAPIIESPQPAAPAAEPTQPAATPPPSRPTTRSSANQKLAPRSEPRSPATPGRTNENSRLGQPMRRSARLNPTAMSIKSQPQAAPAHSRAPLKMARTYPYSLQYRTCLGRLEDPCSFSSIYSGQRTYIKHVQQLVNALPKSMDPTSRFSLRAQVTPAGHQWMRDSLRTALWWLLPKDGDFRRASNGLHYYLARQGRRVVLRGGNVTSPLHESCLHWIHDPNPNQSHRVEPRKTVPRNNTTVPKNNTVQNSDSIPRNPHDPIPSASWYNSSYPVPSASPPRNSVHSHSCPVPSISKENNSGNKMSASATRSSPPSKKQRSRKRRVERRALERESKNSSFIQDARWANQRTAVPAVPAVPTVPAGVTQPLPETSNPTSTMRTAVYPPSRNVGDSPTNENPPFQIGLESSRFSGLLKLAVPGQNQDTWTNNLRARSSGTGPPSPSKHLRARSSGTGPRAGIVYPLQPHGRHPDLHITVEAALPEPAALLRPDLPNPESPVQPLEAPANLSRASRRPCRKRRRNRSTAVFRPAKRSPPRGHWCD